MYQICWMLNSEFIFWAPPENDDLLNQYLPDLVATCFTHINNPVLIDISHDAS